MQIEFGYCHCGCGQKTNIITKTLHKRGHVKGQPLRYITGHNRTIEPKPIADRFWPKVKVGLPDECWEWMGKKSKKGQGIFRGNKDVGSARTAYRLAYGDIPDGLWVLHKCDNPPCCNPNHLFLGTQKDNMHDCSVKGRISRGEKRYNAKLNTKDVINIRTQYNDGFTMREISRTYRVANSTIFNIIHKKSWKHV